MTTVVVDNVVKTYDDLTAVDGFGFEAHEAEIFSLAGPDGAGKTSLFRAMCGLIGFDSGRIEIMGHDIATDFDRVKEILGYMPQTFSLYPDLSVEENLRFYAGLFGLDKSRFEREEERLYEFSGLGPFRRRRAADLSGGMKQKLALSCSLIHDPRVLILDEPTTGVDPLSRRQFWEILTSLRDDGATIVVSTPYMDEVERADRAAFMHRGKKLAEGTPDELAARYQGVVYRVKADPSEETIGQLSGIEGITVRRFGAGLHVYTAASMSMGDLKGKLAQFGIASDQVEKIGSELEDTFIQLMGK
jgi:ABC-2 type transport system ATP-binding protein